MADYVIVRNLRIHGFHGVAPAEKSLGQRFEVDIDCEIDPPSRDAMTETVCYGALCDLAEALSKESTFNLIELFAQKLAEQILARFRLARSVRIVVRKPSAPIRHFVDYVGVSVERKRPD